MAYCFSKLWLLFQNQHSSQPLFEPDIQDEPYYHGFMSRAEANVYLKRNGEFLVRRIQENNNDIFVISVQWKGKKHHFKVHHTRNKTFYYINNIFKQTIPSLIRYYRYNKQSINRKIGVCIIKPVIRSSYVIYREQITIGHQLDEGEFGIVFCGIFRKNLFSRKRVAIKTMKSHDRIMSMDEKLKFLREGNILRNLKHKNVIRLYGVCVYEDPIWIVLEKAQNGNLLKFLKKTNPNSTLKQKFSKEICSGMAYLEKYNIIHRDLAARNCLLDKKNTIKISDFGLSVMGTKSVVIKNGRVPIRWLAPETLRLGKFSNKSDVWSYGVVLYEIWKNGCIPYEKYSTVKSVYTGVCSGKLRLERPKEISEKYGKIMDLCFAFDANERPTFHYLQKIIN